MSDNPTWGIDLSGSTWTSVRMIAEPGSVRFPDEPVGIAGPDLLREAGPLLDLPAEGDPGGPVADEWAELQGWLRQVRDPIRPQLPEKNRVGVAYPRTMPPILRRFLPIVLGYSPATNGGGLLPGTHLVGIDAPVALVLEALARRAIPESGRYAVGTGTGPSREWTAVEVEKAAPSNPAIKGPILRIRLGQTSDSPGSIGVEEGTNLLVAGDLPAESGRPAPVVRMDSTATANGAARFARWHSLELTNQHYSTDQRLKATLLPGAPILFHETIHPVGLIGHDGRGNWFWRRLFGPGTAIPTDRAILRSTTPPPCNFFLAELLSPAHRGQRWLSQQEWPSAQLRWHSTFSHLDKNSPQPPLRWSIELRDFDDTRRDTATPREEVPPRWGLPTWIKRVEADSEEPTSTPLVAG